MTEIIERRKHSGELIELVRQIHDRQLEIGRKIDEHVQSDMLQRSEEIASLLNRCFPNGDPSGHKLHHELLIKKEERRVLFWTKMSEEVTKWGLFGVLGFLAAAAWNSFLQGPHK